MVELSRAVLGVVESSSHGVARILPKFQCSALPSCRVQFLDKEDGCTILVRGFHKNLAEWWGRVEARALQANRPLQASGVVYSVDDLYTGKDVASFGDFELVPCLRGQVRITKPEIVHDGSTVSTSRRVRRTILLWFVGVQDQEKGTLDMEECDTWDSLCLSHVRQTAPKNSPSGHPNKYGKLVHQFPLSTQLSACSYMGQALVCRLSWDDAGVVDQAAQLLGPDRNAAWVVIQRCRLDSLRAFKTAYHHQRTRELECYPADSYYRESWVVSPGM